MIFIFPHPNCKRILLVPNAGKSSNKTTLDWHSRYKIAVGAARGISYLHHDCIPHIIHRDIKSSNILLDDNMEARVSDFGLATLMEPDRTHVSTIVAGTFGYLAPGSLSPSSFVCVCVCACVLHVSNSGVLSRVL